MNKSTTWSEILEEITDHDRATVFRDFVHLAACTIMRTSREEEYLSIMDKYKHNKTYPRILATAFGALIYERVHDPYTDTFGPKYMEYMPNNDPDGRFYTPQCIADLMAALSMPDSVFSNEDVTLADPACGSGVMLLSAARQRREAIEREQISPKYMFRVEGTDLDFTASQMALVNLALAGVPGTIWNANSLTDEVFATWEIPYYFIPTYLKALSPAMKIVSKLTDLDESQKERSSA